MHAPNIIAPAEADKLSSLLSDVEQKDATLAAAFQAFEAAFPPLERLKACCVLALLLQERALPSAPQRLAAWYVLWAAHGGPLRDNPFAAFLINACADAATPPRERRLLARALRDGTLAPLAPLTARGAALSSAAAATDGGGGDGDDTDTDIDALRRLYLGPPPTPQQQPPGALAADGRPPPRWARPAPGVFAPPAAELPWLPAPLGAELLWDSDGLAGGRGGGGTDLAAARALVARALAGPLLPAQQQRVLTALAADPKCARRLGLAPGKLPALVEHAPAVALEALRALAGGGRRAVDAQLEALAAAPLSLHSMEVVNRLSASVALPPWFVRRYVAHCISSCEGAQDTHMQSRLVRLVCVFLSSLVRSRAAGARAALPEVRTFCVGHSRIREAAELFRLCSAAAAGAPAAAAAAAGGGSGGGRGDAGG